MGWRDRDYARGSGGGLWHPRHARIVYWLIGITVGAYFVQGALLGRGHIDLARTLGVVPERLVHGWVWQLFTHAFLHSPGGIGHLLFNMLFLWWIGTDVAELYGGRRFLFLYFGGAATCAIAHTIAAYVEGRPDMAGIGASGAIFAVSVVGAFLFPTRIIYVMFVLPVPLWILVSCYVGLDLYYPLAGLRPWVLSAGHLGGALFGLACHKLHLDLPGSLAFASRLREWWRARGRPSQQQVDRVLDKINADGIGSLTDAERESLRRASR